MSKTLDFMDLEEQFDKFITNIQDFTQETCGCGSRLVHDPQGNAYCPDCGLD